MTTQDRRWLAREVARGLTKTLSARNKEQDRTEFAKLAASFVKLHGPLRLELDGRTMTAAGEKLHDEASSRLGLRFTIEGVRDITLEPGVTEAEVTDLLAALLDRYMAELTASGGLVAAALNSVIGGLSSRDGIEKLIAIGTSGTAEGGPEAFVAVLEALGTAGVQAGLQAYGRTGSKELRDALNTFLAANVGAFPETLKPLVDRNTTAETAKWALFLVSKSVRGPAAEPLLEAGKHHPASAVSEYATFLWKTATPRGRLTAFLDSIDKSDVAERIRAVDALGKAKDAEALPVLVKLVDDPSFLSRPPEEMKAFLGAISEIGGPQMITFFEKQSERSSGIFKIRAGNEVREQAKTLLQQLLDKGGAP